MQKETEWEKKQWQLREVHKILEDGKQMDNWYPLNRVEQLTPACLQGETPTRNKLVFLTEPQKTSELELPSISEGRRGAEEATNKRICGISVFHLPPAQWYSFC